MPIRERIKNNLKSSDEENTDSFINKEKDPRTIWDLMDNLGDGAFAKVRKAQNIYTIQIAAVKIFSNCSEDDEYQTHKVEALIMQKCQHKNIVKLFEAFYFQNTLYVSCKSKF
jgi:serine/threonine protein kinase